VLIDVHHMAREARAVVAAGEIVEAYPGPGGEPNVEGIDKNAIRIIWIDRHSLVVPVLRVVAGVTRTVQKGTAAGAGHKAPRIAAISAAPNTELATASVTAPSIIIRRDGTNLSVDVIRIAGRDGDIHASKLRTGARTAVGRPAAGVHVRAGRIGAAAHGRAVNETVVVASDQGEIRRATARRHRAFVKAVRPVLIEVVLDCRSEPAGADRGEDSGNAADVR
jgi:hypothetical protein